MSGRYGAVAVTMNDHAERLLTIREVAEKTGESERTIRRWVDDDLLPVERVGPCTLKRVRIRISVLRRFYPADLFI